MSYPIARILGALVLTAALVTPAWAADKEHKQLMADLRILQEQTQLLQNQLGLLTSSLTEALKAVNLRIDDQTNATRKALADQKLALDPLTVDARVIREKLDDNNVRIGSLAQEVDALRQGIQQLSARAPSPDAVAPAPGTAPEEGVPPPAGQPPLVAIGTSPQKLWENAYSDYTLGQWSLAVAGFESFIKTFPKHDQADDAQVYIGNSYLNAGQNERAIEAYDVAIRTYPGGNALPEALYKKGLALKNLKELDRAREAFETVVKSYPDSAAAGLASQQLAQLGRQ
jgi:tol-pal system protein YbgF